MGKFLMLPALAHWACCILGGSVVSATACNSDNCLRALFPTQSPAVYSSDAAFCATYTTSINTMTTGFPSKASASCGTSPARYSSACSCKPTIASTLSTTQTSVSSTASMTPTCSPTPANNIVQNGGFECGLSPWVAADVVDTAHAVTSPGDGSNFAYEFDQVGPVTQDSSMHPASVNQDLTVAVGGNYTLTFRTYFNTCTQSEGFVGLMLNHQAVYTVDACDHGAGDFTDNTVTFTAAANPENLRFEFIIGEDPATVKIDNVVVVPA